MTGTNPGNPRHLRIHRFQAQVLRNPVSQLLRRQGSRVLGRAGREGRPVDHHQPALDLSGPADQRRPDLRLRRRRPGQGRLAARYQGRPGADGLPDRHRHGQIARQSRLPLAGADQDLHGPAEGPEHVLGGGLGLFPAGHHGHRPPPPFPLERRPGSRPSPAPEFSRVLPPDRPRDLKDLQHVPQDGGRRREHLFPLGPRLHRHHPGGLPQRLAGKREIPQIRQGSAHSGSRTSPPGPWPSPWTPTASISIT